jgi:hypothetical protein
MGQIVTRKFIATGSAMNLDLGFIPAYARVHNMNAAAGEVFTLEYFNLNGDSAETWIYCINDQGTAVAADRVKKASGGYLAEYDSTVVGAQRSVTFDYTGGAAEDLLTCANALYLPSDNDKVKFIESGGLATGLSELINYWVIDSGTYGSGTFRVSLTKGGSAVAMTSDGTPANYFINLSQAEPTISGGKGLTISASFQADSDVLYVFAVEADSDKDLGDAANW